MDEITLKSKRKNASYIFKYLLFAQITVYLETGTIPCLLDTFGTIFNMNTIEQGWLGSIVYISLCIASPLSAIAYKNIEAKYVLGISLVLNNFSLLGFALTPTGYKYSSVILIIMRGFIGFTQSFLCVYTPLWVDTFSPRHRIGGWMSYLQGSVPLGVMFGYLFGSMSNWFNTCYFIQCWRIPFLIQFLFVFPLMIGIFFIPKKHFSIIKKKKKIIQKNIYPIVLKEMILIKKKSNLSFSNWNELDLNQAQYTAISASYTTPRVPMDAYDIETIYYDDTMDSSYQPISYSDSSPISYGATHSPPRNVDSNSLPPHPPSTFCNYMSAPPVSQGDMNTVPSSMVSSMQSYRTAQSNIDSPPLTITPEEFPQENPADISILTNSQWHPLKSSHSPTSTSLPPYNNPPVSQPPLFGRRISQRGVSSVVSSRYDEDDEDDLYLDEDMGFFKSLRVLLMRPLFTLIVLGLSAIYFVVTGVQFWSTIYLLKNFDSSIVIVNGLFVVVAGTGPIWGVFFGGALIDHAGGYMGSKQRAKALGICVMLGLIAFLLGMITTFLPNLYLVAGSLWLLLFFGGSILPSCTGIFISSTPVQLRSLASSVSVMVFNLLGYALAPALTGSFMELIHNSHLDPTSYWYGCDEACMYRVGFRCCLAWSVWSLIAMVAAYYYAKKQADHSIIDQDISQEKPITIMMH